MYWNITRINFQWPVFEEHIVRWHVTLNILSKPSFSRMKVIHEWHLILAILFLISFFVCVGTQSNAQFMTFLLKSWCELACLDYECSSISFSKDLSSPNRSFYISLFLVCVGFQLHNLICKLWGFCINYPVFNKPFPVRTTQINYMKLKMVDIIPHVALM